MYWNEETKFKLQKIAEDKLQHEMYWNTYQIVLSSF